MGSVLEIQKARFWPKMNSSRYFFRFFGSFSILKGSPLRAGGRGVWGEFRPLRSIFAEIGSDIFESTPPVGKLGGIGKGSPADFPFMNFLSLPAVAGRPKAGFPNFLFNF